MRIASPNVGRSGQAEKKDKVNKSEVKIGADELPAVTQLFTEDYMILFLLHNTLGAWWEDKVLAGIPPWRHRRQMKTRYARPPGSVT
jgi:hypothetical protein